MEKIEKTIRYTKLFNLYGALLSSAQQEVLSDYFFADLSISEISENRGISRAAVEDALSKGMKKLDSFESIMELKQKRDKILENTQVLKEKMGNCKEIEEIEEVLK